MMRANRTCWRVLTGATAALGMCLTCLMASWNAFVPPALESTAAADEPTPPPMLMKHQITGLFCPEREQDFRELCAEKLAKFKLTSIDYANAEATFAYDPAKEFPGAKPEQVIERLDNEVRNVSKSTFGVRPLRTKSLDELERVEFAIVGLDCKACSLAVYEILLRLKGVEQATASFKTGKATALFDPRLIDRATLEKALRERGVTLKPAE